MSTSDDEQIRRLGAVHEGDHLNVLERLEAVCTSGTPGQAANIVKLLADGTTHAGAAMASLQRSMGPPRPTPTTGNKGPLPSAG